MIDITEELKKIKNEIDVRTSQSWTWLQVQQNYEYLKKVANELDGIISEYQKEAKESEKLQGELEKKQKEKDELQKNLVESQNNVKSLKKEVADLEKKVSDNTSGSEKKELIEKLENKKGELQKAENNVKLLEEKRDDLNKEVSRLQEALIKKIGEGNQSSAGLKKQLANLRNSLEGVEKERDARPNIEIDKWDNDYSKRPTQKQLEQAVQAKINEYKDYIAPNNLEESAKKAGLGFTQEDVNNAVKEERDKWKGFISPDKLKEEAKKKSMITKEENDVTLNELNGLKKQLEEVKSDKVKLEQAGEELKNEKAKLLKISQVDKEKLAKLEQQLTINQKQLNGLEQGKKEVDNQKQELTKKVTDLEGKIDSQQKKMKDLENKNTQLADYEKQVSELKQEIFKLKNERNTELEKVKKQLNDFLVGDSQPKEIDTENQLKEVDIEEAKRVMSEYLKFIGKELKNLRDLEQIGKEKGQYREKQKKLEVEIERINQIISKLTIFSQQMIAQVEQVV